VNDPQKALRYAQLFLWWQVLSGLVQVTGITAFVFLGPLSASTYAFYGFFLLLHAVVQFPGFFVVSYHLLQGAQRFDYAAALDVIETRLFKVLVPIPFVLLFRAWGRHHPAYGEAFGAIVGLAVGAYLTQWLMFGIGLLFCRRAGLPVRPLFGASFGRAEVRDVFSFGWKAILGQVAFRAANSIEILVLAELLTSYTERLGIWSLLQMRFSYLVLLAYAFFDSGVAVFGEALGAEKRAFAQYQVARFLQFACLWGAVVFAILCALGPTFIRGALEPQWHRAAEFVGVAAFARALACPGWVSDALQRGANRPLVFSGVLAAEQALRLLLFLLFVPRLQLLGLYAAIILSLGLKTIAAWWLNHRWVLPLRLSVWQSVGAPLVTGALLWAALSGITLLVHPATSLGAQALFYGGALGGLVASFVMLGLLGGLDAHGLGEIDRATRMTSLLAPVARIFAIAARTGARLSPLHDRFPQPTTIEALREAEELRSV
jgi:O-antigen/teichoic acid export membrane protein